MSPRPMARPGGRSARVQESVHAAVRDLVGEVGRDALTVPMVATRAGVTPSTIYRRWGDLQELLSDVAVERLRPDAPPPTSAAFARTSACGRSSSWRRWLPRRDAPISATRFSAIRAAATPASVR